jgi:hypothetical protein
MVSDLPCQCTPEIKLNLNLSFTTCNPCLLSQVHHPTRSHQETAAALQQSLYGNLASSLPGQLIYTSSAWVRGCVHMFVWAAHLPSHLLGRVTGHSFSVAAEKAAPEHSAPEGPTGWELTAPISSDIASRLAGSAAAAGAEGEVDVQIGKQPGRRYQLEPGKQPAAVASPAEPAEPNVAASTHTTGLQICSISPPCMSLSDLGAGGALGRLASTTLNLQLTSQQAQQARVVIMAAATWVLLVDKEYGVLAGDMTTLAVEIPVDGLGKAAHGNRPSREHACGHQPVVPLRLIITTPTQHADTSQRTQPVRLLATATLLAAPAPLASELCSLYALMQQQGQQEGLGDQEVWSLHWQVLMNDLALCLMAADDFGSATTGAGTAMSVQQVQAVGEVADSLCKFFSGHAMLGWQAQMQASLQALGHQQGHCKQALLWEREGVAATPSHRDVPAGPATPLVAKQSDSTAAPAAGVHDDSVQKPQKPQKPGAVPAIGTSSGTGAASKGAPHARHAEAETPPPVHHYSLSFRDQAQEQRYRDWAMRRARVPIRVW